MLTNNLWFVLNGMLSEIELFNKLKTCVQNRFLQENTAASNNIYDWKGQDIVNFQEDLGNVTKARVSEKWFYTYMKSDVDKLPRIDMLNLLANYCGFNGWADFVNQQQMNHEDSTQVVEKIFDQESNPTQSNKNSKTLRFWIGSSIILLLAVFCLLFFGQNWLGLWKKGTKYEFEFVNADRNKTITDLIEVTLQWKGFVPEHISSTNGKIAFYSKQDTLEMIVKSYYYETDTFRVNLQNYQQAVEIELNPDNYKLVWQYYLQSNVEVRKEKLENSIQKNAQIYRVYENQPNFIEPFSREEYINFLLLPTTSLDQFKIIASEKKNGKFSYIKFKIKQDEE